jgi:hypothetical protein
MRDNHDGYPELLDAYEHMGIGMDSAWFSTLESATRDSMAWNGPTPEKYEVP